MYLGRNHSWVPLVKPQYGKTFSRRNVYIPQVVIPVRQGNSHDSHERRVYAHRLIDFYKVYQNMRWKGTKIQTFEGAPSSSNISMNPRIVTSIHNCVGKSDVSYTYILPGVRAYGSSSTGYFHFLNRPSSESRKRLNFLLCQAWREAVRVTKATNELRFHISYSGALRS